MRKFITIAPALIVLMTTVVLLLAGPAMMHRYTFAQQYAQITLAREVLSDDDILRRIDRAISAIADAVEPSVVHIEAQGTEPNSGGTTGSGWIYDAEGHIITNAHVVRNAKEVAVEFFDGRVVRAKVLGKDPYTDIAVIQIPDPGSYFPARRSMQRLPRRGERVFAFGSPFGFKFSMSEGIVSGLGRQAPGSNVLGGYTNYIQTDAAVNPGNSGGPLVNTDGHVIGMSVAIATARSIGGSIEDSGGDSAGISFAIPLGTIEPIVSQIIRFGSVSHGYLGIMFNPRQGNLQRWKTDDGVSLSGILVTGLESDGPSYAAGMKTGDIITAIEGSPITTVESLSTLVSSGRPGDTINVRVYRDHRPIDDQPVDLRLADLQPVDIKVKLAAMKPQVLAGRIAQPIMVQLGMLINRRIESPVRILQVWDGFPAASAGLLAGDRVVAIDGISVNNTNRFFVLLAERGLLTGETVTLSVIDFETDQQRDVRLTLYP
ncbi:MAG: trypsin-like peptidase domain-containing protein [Phycisphaerales bacterium]|nr:trypsin-like peptidase domain-containing protein [Phycisphaerales bacterium]